MAAEHLSDDDLLRLRITPGAIPDRGVVSEEIAYLIATGICDGPTGAVLDFVVTGAIDEEGMVDELLVDARDEALEPAERCAARLLGLYVLRTGDRPEQENWAEL